MLIDPLKDLPGYALRRASLATMEELARRLAALALRPTEATVLVVIDVNPGITQSETGQLLDIARANMAPLAARLLDRDLIVRERVNGRSQGLSLSAAGRQLAKRVRQAMSEQEASILRRIPQAHHRAFIAALHTLWMPEEPHDTAQERDDPKSAKRPSFKMRSVQG